MEKMLRDWAGLPGELLELTLSKLFGFDRHSFRLVCESWNKVASTSPYRYSPCLMHYTSKKKHLWTISQYDNLFHLDREENTEIRCSKFGWLLMSRSNAGGTLFFLDPFNNRKIELPCLLPPDDKYTSICFTHPPTSPDCAVVGFHVPLDDTFVVKICVLKHGEGAWDVGQYRLKNQLTQGRLEVSRGAPILHRGLVHLVDMKGDVATFDINKHESFSSAWTLHSKCLSRNWKGVEFKDHFLFKIKGGEEEEALFGVFLMNEERKVKVFRLVEPRMKWELVEDIGEDKVLYLSHCSSFGDTAYLKCMANRIYFPYLHGTAESGLFYSLTTGNYHSLDGNFSANNTLGIKRLDFAAWIMPAPTPPPSDSDFNQTSTTWFC